MIRVNDMRPKPREEGTFLGMRLVDPDTSGSISYDAAARGAAWNAVDRLIRFVPAMTALMALAVVGLGRREVRAQAELALAMGLALAGTLWLSPRIGAEYGWLAGAVLGGAALAMLLARGRIRAVLAGALFCGLWYGVWVRREWMYPDPDRVYMALGLGILGVGGMAVLCLGAAAILRLTRRPGTA